MRSPGGPADCRHGDAPFEPCFSHRGDRAAARAGPGPLLRADNVTHGRCVGFPTFCKDRLAARWLELASGALSSVPEHGFFGSKVRMGPTAMRALRRMQHPARAGCLVPSRRHETAGAPRDVHLADDRCGSQASRPGPPRERRNRHERRSVEDHKKNRGRQVRRPTCRASRAHPLGIALAILGQLYDYPRDRRRQWVFAVGQRDIASLSLSGSQSAPRSNRSPLAASAVA